MGNRKSTSQRKQREYATPSYSENRSNDYVSKTGGNKVPRQTQPQPPAYQQQQNGYTANPTTQTNNSYNKSSSSKNSLFNFLKKIIFSF
jgi:hypothetical protein